MALTLGFDSLPRDSATLLEYVLSGNAFTKNQRGFGWLGKVTNRDIEECPVWDGSSLWVITRVSIERRSSGTGQKRWWREWIGNLLFDVDTVALG